MGHLLTLLRFAGPYLRRYRARMAMGILLGVLYGFSNGAALWCARLAFDRLAGTPPADLTAPNAALAGNGIFSGVRTSWQHANEVLQDALDPWLPAAGRKLDWRQTVGVLLALPLLLAFRGFTGYFSNYYLTWVSDRTVCELRVDILSRLSGLSLEYFTRARSGDLITRVNTDTVVLQTALGSRLSDLVKEPVTIVSILALLIALNAQLTLFVLIFLPLCVIPIGKLGRKAREAGRRVAQASTLQSGLLVEFLAGIRVVKAFGLESRQRDRFVGLTRELFGQGMRAMRAREMVNPIIEVISGFALSGLILYIAYRGVQFADLVTFLAGTATLYTPIKRLSQMHVTFVQASVAVERIQQILDERPSVVDPVQPKPVPPFQREIAFDHVSFGYDQRLVLTDFSLSIPRGLKLGVAGESGSGKSTLVNLLFRFYDPTAGRILLDGVDLREMAGADLRSMLALVGQDVVIFDLTVAENIACGHADATRAEIEAAAQAAFAHEFIKALPQGYDTPVGERGVTLSGGQRQRLSIARAFIRNAPVLVLDEATASLDSQSEREVQDAIERLEQNRTVLCVAHRLSTLMNMDRVVTLAAGRIVESGTPRDLLRAKGPFAAMAKMQGLEAS